MAEAKPAPGTRAGGREPLMQTMTVTVRYVGIAADQAGSREESIELAAGSTLSDLMARIGRIGKRSRYVNEWIWLVGDPATGAGSQARNLPLQPGQVVTVIPMIAGG